MQELTAGAGIEPPELKAKTYQQAQDLIEVPEFLKLGAEQAIKQIHQETTVAIDWNGLKNSTPTRISYQSCCFPLICLRRI